MKCELRDPGLGVNLLCYIEEKNGTAVLLREIENFKRSEFEPSRVTCILNNIKEKHNMSAHCTDM